MALSNDATAVMQYLAESYPRNSAGQLNRKTFTFDRKPEDTVFPELLDHGLIEPDGISGIRFRFTEAGHGWAVEYRGAGR
jgi:hypothetical protein